MTASSCFCRGSTLDLMNPWIRKQTNKPVSCYCSKCTYGYGLQTFTLDARSCHGQKYLRYVVQSYGKCRGELSRPTALKGIVQTYTSRNLHRVSQSLQNITRLITNLELILQSFNGRNFSSNGSHSIHICRSLGDALCGCIQSLCQLGQVVAGQEKSMLRYSVLRKSHVRCTDHPVCPSCTTDSDTEVLNSWDVDACGDVTEAFPA